MFIYLSFYTNAIRVFLKQSPDLFIYKIVKKRNVEDTQDEGNQSVALLQNSVGENTN